MEPVVAVDQRHRHFSLQKDDVALADDRFEEKKSALAIVKMEMPMLRSRTSVPLVSIRVLTSVSSSATSFAKKPLMNARRIISFCG